MNRSMIASLLALTAALAMPARQATAQHAVPFRGTYATTFTLAPGPAPGVFELQFNAVGHANHLGHSGGPSTHLLNALVNPNTQVGTSTFFAANGDRLDTTYSGIAAPPGPNGVIQFSGTLTITGGTGRFRNATGSAAVVGTANVGTGTGQFTFSGTISK
jgi:hypothetical protein